MTQRGNISRKPNGMWQVRVTRSMPDGSRRERKATCRTEHEAQIARARLITELDGAPPDSPMTLEEYYRGVFVPQRRGRLTRATMADYDCQWRNHIEPAFGAVPLSGVRHADVQRWVLTMSRPTAEHAVRTLRAILRSAWEDDLIRDEPMRKPIRYPRRASAERRLWDASETMRATDVMRGHPLEPVYLLMVGGGLRRSEALAVTWGKVSWFEAPDGSLMASVAVDGAITVKDGMKATKNRYSARQAVVAPPFAARLRDASGADVLRCSVGSIPHMWKRLWSDAPSRDPYAGSMAQAGVPYLELRAMRAVHETLQQQAGVLDTVNSRMHGRTNVSTGYRHYLQPATAAYVDAASKMGGLFGRRP